MTPNELLAYFESRREAMIDEIRELVDIESPSYDAAASRQVADWIESKARDTGAPLTVDRIAVEDGEHVVIRAYPGEGPHTLLLGHTDTVHPKGTFERNQTRIEEGRLYGCGVFDMKSGVVLMLEALRHFAASGTRPTTPITILLTCDEEVGSFTGKDLLDREAPGASQCFVFEPSLEGRLKTGRKGTGMFTLAAHGRPAHAGLEPEKGASAVAELARHVERINSIGRPDIGTTVNVTTFHGGTTMNVIPEQAVCDIDVRFSLTEEATRVSGELNSFVSFDERVRLVLEGDINRPPMERTLQVIALYKKARDLAASFGYELGEAQVGGGSDGNFVAAMGVPVLDGLGITGDGAHTLYEHIVVSDIAKRATLVTLLLS